MWQSLLDSLRKCADIILEGLEKHKRGILVGRIGVVIEAKGTQYKRKIYSGKVK